MSRLLLNKILFTLSLYLFSTNMLFSQIETIENKRELKNLKGPIKSCTINYYEAKDYFGELKKISEGESYIKFEKDSLGRITHFETYDFNDDFTCDIEHLTKDNTIKLIGIDEGKKVIGTYNLNSRNQIIEHSYYKDDTLVGKETAEYNEYDSLTQYKRYRKDGSLYSMRVQEYDSSNRLIYKKNVSDSQQYEEKFEYASGKLIKSKKIFDSSGKHTYTWLYKYGENKKVSQIIIINELDKQYQSKTVFDYDSSGNKVTESESTMNDGLNFSPTTITEYKYDSQKRLLEETKKRHKSDNLEEWYTNHHTSIKYNNNGNKISEEEYSSNPDYKNSNYKSQRVFEYDYHGNCIKRISTYSNDLNMPFETLKKSVEERIITYYE